MGLDEMTLSEKRQWLVSLMNKANSDINYKTSVCWGYDFEFSYQEMRMLIADYIEMFEMGRFDSLDYDQRQIVTDTFNKRFDVQLSKFPEFFNSLDETSPSRN